MHNIKLSLIERVIIANQLEILIRLEKQDNDHHKRILMALKGGYEGAYHLITQSFDVGGLSWDECEFVENVLDFYSAGESFVEGNATDPIKYDKFRRFAGFDGNNETKFMAYAKWLVSDGDRYSKFEGREMNSHRPMLHRYKILMKRWEEKGKPTDWSQQLVDEIFAL